MGTRGFISFVADGVEKTAYNHNDSYPGGLGLDVLNWLRREHMGRAARLARELRVIRDGDEPTEADIERLKPYADLGVSRRSLDDWYCLLRHTQGNPAAMLDAGVIEDASHFPTDSLFAEYGYVIDFDASRLEAYVGFQKAPHDEGRFAGRTGPDDSRDYFPVRLVASWPLDALPTDGEFVKAIDGDEENQ